MAKIISNIKERILKVAENQKVNKETFFEELGLGYGNFKGKAKETQPGADIIAKIIAKYPNINVKWLLTGEGEMLNDEDNAANLASEPKTDYILQRRHLKLEPKEIYFPLYRANTRLREDPMIQVYEDDPEMQVPVSFLPQNAFPGCDHGEIATGNSMYPRVVNGGMALGKVIDKTRLVYNELYGIHVKGGSPPVIKYVHESEKPGYITFVSERESLKNQDWAIDEITFMFRVLFIVNPA
ncbi:MAG: hypothetical protein JWQ09_1034 [Segetibacter sp.]|nr:hypothetical protein [Segetibacter sp.]